MITHTTDIRVRYAETDAGGIVYHSNYIVWFDIARTELIRSLGLCYKTLEKEEKVHLAVIDVNVKYLKSASFDDILNVTATIHEVPRVKTTIRYEVQRNNELIATGQTQHAFISLENQTQPIKPPEHFVDLIRKNLKKICDNTI